MSKTTKKQRIEYVKESMATTDEFAIRCMLAVANRDDSMRSGLGFRNCDSRIMWSFVGQYRERGKLSDNQMRTLRKIMPRYARQLVERHIPSEWIEMEMAGSVSKGSNGGIESDHDMSGWACTIGAR